MTQRLDLAIAPGKHLGWFRLGMSLWDVIRLLREQAALVSVVELKYSEEDPFAADIVLKLPSNGIELRFEPYSQRLKLITVYDFMKSLRLTYSGSEFSSPKVVPTCALVNKLIGPPFPGEFDSSRNLYTLSYPGLSFVFPIPEKHILLYQQSAEVPMEFPDGSTPVCTHMYIYHGADWMNATPVSVATLARNIQDSSSSGHHSGRTGEGRAELERVVAKINYGALLQFAGATQPQKCVIQLHVTTPQDLLADLGSPGSIYYKEDDKMQIHSDTEGVTPIQTEDDGILGEMEDIGYDRANRPAQGSQQPNDYFYNYFHLGIDVLFDGSTHRCKKIVMHTNIPGHFDFQSYKRCPFILHLPSPSTPSDTEAARLPPIPPLPAPVTETMKTGRKKNRNSAAAAIQEGSENNQPSFYSSDSARGSPDLLGTSPNPSSDQEFVGSQHQQQQQQQQQVQASPTNYNAMLGGLTAVSPEKGITPDMKIQMIMALLDPTGSLASGAGVPNKQGLILNRGSSTQNPFKYTTLYGTDGVVFETMFNGHVATVFLY